MNVNIKWKNRNEFIGKSGDLLLRRRKRSFRRARGGTLTRILTQEGYIDVTGTDFNHYYYVKDYQGNNCMVLNSSGDIVQATNYYPYGASFAEKPERTDQWVQPYKFNGKELDRIGGLDYYDYSARIYDPIGDRFWTMDPMAEKYPWLSPYAYCANNPVKYVDLHGDSLTYSGDAQAAINMHNTHLNGYYNVSADATTGLVSMTSVADADMSKMSPEQKAYADALGEVVNGTDGMTRINVVSGDNNVLFGDISTATIDVGDMGKLPTAELAPITSGSVLIHEVTEQYNMQVNSATLDPRNPGWDAHKKAARVEGTVIQQRLGITPAREFIPSSPGSTSGYMDVNSSNGKARVYIRNNNVVGVSYHK